MPDIKQESRREIAERIVSEWADAHQVDQAGPGTKARLVDSFEVALKERDEWAAGIAKREAQEWSLTADIYKRNDPMYTKAVSRSEMALEIATAIANGDTNA